MGTRSLTLLGAVLSAAACARTGASSPPAPSAAPDPAVAEVAGATVRLSEVDERASSRLARLKDEEYEARRAALDEIIAERLAEKEAAARGLSKEALIKAEVDDRLTMPSEAQVRDIFERNRARLPGVSLEAVRDDIVASLRQRDRAERQDAFQKALRDKAAIKVTLQQPRTTVRIPADAPALGPSDAPVTLVEFLDYQCPYCHRVQPLVDQLLERYKGKVRFVHREFLLGSPRALPSARAARCAGEQGRFWEYHRDLLLSAGDMSDADLRHRAVSFGLDPGRFEACLASRRYDAQIRQSSDQGQELGVSGTPTFFINGRRLTGVRPLDQYTQMIEAELAGS